MKRYYSLLLLVSSLYLFSIISCTPDSTDQPESSNIESIRPYNPWVFRSVLDGRPRMITFALDDKLYASYSTQTGAIYKTWNGNVLFEGAVYNSAHGPQPISFGDAYFINVHEQPWIITKNGKNIDFTYQYIGHKFLDKDHAVLMHSFIVGDDIIQINEQPEIDYKDDNIAFERTFSPINIPEGFQVAFQTNISSVLVESFFSTTGDFNKRASEPRKSNGAEVIDIDGVVVLNNNDPTVVSAILSDKALIINPNNELVSEDDLEDNEGKELIGKNDCKSCHNTYVKTIGPSYNAIAEKYPTSDDNVFYLVNKIINGGSGIWGEVPMSAHPELAKEDAETMVRYILSLDKDDEGVVAQSAINKSDYFPALENISGTIPGALVKVYNNANNINSMPDYSSMKPTMGGVLRNFDNLEGGDFTKLSDHFGLTGEGYLEISETKEYAFRMWSDDGSKLFIDNKLVVDNDGNHGTEYKEKTIGLDKGFHSFRIEYYQGLGGKFLSFNWKPQNEEAWQVVPGEVISHDALSQQDLAGLSLPMSTVTQVPGDGIAVSGVHPSFEISQLRPEEFLPKVGGLDVLSDGRIILSTWDPEGAVYFVDYKNASSPSDITYKKIASGLAEPLGVKIVGDDIYIMQKQEMTQLIDLDGDEIIDEYRVVCNDWKVSANFHEFGFGLEEKDDYLYATLAIGIMPGGASAQNQPEDRGKVIRVNRKTGDIEFPAYGLRTPNGIGLGFNNDIYVADNQGDWLPASKILHITEDAFFNSRAVDFEGTANTPVKPPVVWLPQDEIGNSPSTPSYLNVGPYKNQMIHGEVTHGGLKRVFVEEVEGQFQGALFRFSQGFEAGINRISWIDNENLVVGGIGNPGNWQHNGKKWYGLQKFSYTGEETFEMLAVRAKTNGIEIEFTQPLNNIDGWDPASYSVQQFYYKPTENYGGPKLGQEDLSVKSASVSDDRSKVFLELSGMKEGHVLHLTLLDHFVSNKNQGLWSTESWYTLNKIPKNTMGMVKNTPFTIKDNTLTEGEKAAGWKLLFNGENTENLRTYKKQELGSSWKVENGVLFLDSEKNDQGHWFAPDGGDVVITDKPYEDFELSLDWKISNCGNSGIIYNVKESDSPGWHTGPEFQILDNTCHIDAKLADHRAGALYDLIETSYVTVKPAGEWNTVRLISKNGKIEHWLNGHKIVSYDTQNDNWQELIKNSKFTIYPEFGTYSKGHILLQDHADPVYFKNIKIREL